MGEAIITKATPSIITVAHGGTGAATASSARTNLDVYSKSEVDTSLQSKANTSTIGDLSTLSTSAKTNIVSAINEIYIKSIIETELFSDSNGTQGPITLSDSAANYDYIEIFYRTNDGDINSRRVYSANGKYVELSATLYNDSGFYLKTAWVMVSLTSVTWNTYGFARLRDNNPAYVTNDNKLYITRITGYNHVLTNADEVSY